jgi:hypothetical protein
MEDIVGAKVMMGELLESEEVRRWMWLDCDTGETGKKMSE